MNSTRSSHNVKTSKAKFTKLMTTPSMNFLECFKQTCRQTIFTVKVTDVLILSSQNLGGG